MCLAGEGVLLIVTAICGTLALQVAEQRPRAPSGVKTPERRGEKKCQL